MADNHLLDEEACQNAARRNAFIQRLAHYPGRGTHVLQHVVGNLELTESKLTVRNAKSYLSFLLITYFITYLLLKRISIKSDTSGEHADVGEVKFITSLGINRIIILLSGKLCLYSILFYV